MEAIVGDTIVEEVTVKGTPDHQGQKDIILEQRSIFIIIMETHAFIMQIENMTQEKKEYYKISRTRKPTVLTVG